MWPAWAPPRRRVRLVAHHDLFTSAVVEEDVGLLAALLVWVRCSVGLVPLPSTSIHTDPAPGPRVHIAPVAGIVGGGV